MDLISAQCAAVERIEGAMQMPAKFMIEAGDELRNLLLCDGGGEVDVPDGEAGEGFGIAREQAVEEGGAASQVAEDEKRFFDGLCFMAGEQDVVEPEQEPVDKRARSPDQIEQYQKDNSFSGEGGGSVFGVEE